MRHVKLGDLEVSRIGLGAMGMSTAYIDTSVDEAQAIATIHRALEVGVTLIDTAEVYGPYANEELIARALKGRRNEAVLATKFGMISQRKAAQDISIALPRISESPSKVRCNGSTPTTSTCTTNTESIHTRRSRRRWVTLAELVGEGKIRHIGLSEAAPDTIRRAHGVHPGDRLAVGVLAVDP